MAIPKIERSLRTAKSFHVIARPQAVAIPWSKVKSTIYEIATSAPPPRNDGGFLGAVEWWGMWAGLCPAPTGEDLAACADGRKMTAKWV